MLHSWLSFFFEFVYSIYISFRTTRINHINLFAKNVLLQGGSLKKESLANLHLLSATNEGKVSQQEIKQQIPVKLSSKLSVSTGAGTGSKVR